MSASFEIGTNSVKSCPQAMKSQSDQVRRMADSVRNCSRALSYSMNNPAVTRKLNFLFSQMLEEASKEKKLSDALEHAIRFYDNAEKAIINAGSQAGIQALSLQENSSGQTGTDKRSWFRKILDTIFGRKVDTSLTATTAEQEAAADADMKRRAEDLLRRERFSEETWNNASVAERRQILQEYLNELETIMGVSVSGNLGWFNESPGPDGITVGQYLPGSNRIELNEYILTQSNSYHLMSTLRHEMRHCYQHHAVNHPDQYQVTQQTINDWKHSIDTYQDECRRGNYRNILIEQDARRFAGQE